MIGIVVSGHGTFASGITSGLRLLAGEPVSYEAVDFSADDSTEVLDGNMEAAIERLKGCGQILILTDLVGGSPFNVALKRKLTGAFPMEVVGGVNLPVLLEAYLSREMAEDVASLAQSSVKAGVSQLVWYQPSESDEEEYED